MSRSISLFLSRTGGPPHLGSVGYVNDAVAPILQRQGWEVRSFRPPPAAGSEEALLPFGLAAQHALEMSAGRPDVALFDCAGTTLRAPSRRWAERSMVIYHGLVYGPGNWLTNTDIDLHCANSPYLARVLRALFAYPDWRNRRLLNPSGFAAVTDLRLPLPCVVAPEGHPGFAQGADLPAELLRLADRGVVLGHALQPGKQDMLATLSILYWLNLLSRERGLPGVRLLISDASLGGDTRAVLDGLLAGSGFSCADFFIPLPHLRQQALVRLMRACRFGLAYNRFAEPFGFYVLESVFNGCPVYSNGAGNNRFLLPPDHGIRILESPAMAGESGQPAGPEVYRQVAEGILDDLASPARVRVECERGRALIAGTWTPAAFEQSLLGALQRLDEAPQAAPDFEALVVSISPLVRSLDLQRGHSLNDYGSGVLPADALTALREVLGRRCGELDSGAMVLLEERFQLFAKGLLCLDIAGEAVL